MYRKLARDLHPDRIADADERARKTALMKDANRAYEAHDLLTLLELQWQIEQLDPAGMAGFADAKLTHFIHVLKAQVLHLKSELGSIAAPFAAGCHSAPMHGLRPLHVDRQVDRELAEVHEAIGHLQDDLRRYSDPVELKRDLSGPLREMLKAPDVDPPFDDLAWYDEPAARPRKRGKRR